MSDPAALMELDTRIAALRENIRELVEQAAASSGAADESLVSERIAAFEAKLAAVLKERDRVS